MTPTKPEALRAEREAWLKNRWKTVGEVQEIWSLVDRLRQENERLSQRLETYEQLNVGSISELVAKYDAKVERLTRERDEAKAEFADFKRMKACE